MADDEGLTRGRRGRERRRSRLGVLGVALFVGGPVLGAAIAVVAVVIALDEEPRWVLVAVGGVAIGLALTLGGLRLLLRLEDERAADAPDRREDAGPGEESDPSDADA